MVRARTLDGIRLWLSFDSPTSGQIVLVSEGGEELIWSIVINAGPQTLLLDLEDVPGDEPAAFDLVFRSEAGDRPMCFAHDFAVPTRPPVTPDGRWRYRVVAPEGRLRLRRHAVDPADTVTSLDARDGSLEVTWKAENARGLAILDEDGALLHTVPVEAVDGSPGEFQARFTADLALPIGVRLPLMRVDDAGRLPLGRPHHDLKFPMTAVLLPAVTGAKGRTLRFVWSRDGYLHLRMDEAEEFLG